MKLHKFIGVGVFVLYALSAPALGAKQEEPKKFKYAPAKAYVFARISGGNELLLERLNPKDGKFFGVKGGEKAAKGEDDDAILGGKRAFVGSNGRSYHLTALTPGTWVIMGNSRTCMCMGSYKFTVNAGEVIDLGEFMFVRESALPLSAGPAAEVPEDLRDRPYAIADAMRLKPASDVDPALPEAFKSLPVKVATYDAGVEFANVRGKLINRAMDLPPMVPPRDRFPK